jgi:hypothetical protein
MLYGDDQAETTAWRFEAKVGLADVKVEKRGPSLAAQFDVHANVIKM